MRHPGVGRIDEEGRAHLSIAETARFLRVSRRTIHRLLQKGLLESVQVSNKGARRLIPIDSIEAYQAHRGMSLVDLTKRVLDLERKVAFLMTQGRDGHNDPKSYDRMMESLRKNHPDIYS